MVFSNADVLESLRTGVLIFLQYFGVCCHVSGELLNEAGLPGQGDAPLTDRSPGGVQSLRSVDLDLEFLSIPLR